MTAAEIASRFSGSKKSGDGWIALCPAHDDRNPSLSISPGADGRTLLHCHSGCSLDSICTALNIKPSDLFADKPARNGHAGEIVAQYDYCDANGKLLFQVVRFQPKDFRQRKPDVTALDGWTWRTKGIAKVLFRLPEIIRDVKRGLPVFIVEGEKDTLQLVKHGFTATCNPGGAGKWQDSFSETLRGADVIIIPDKDQTGREHAQLVAGNLRGIAKSVRLIELPDLNGKPVKDAADFFRVGGDAGQLQDLVDHAPEWTPRPQPTAKPESSDIHADIVSILTNDKLSAAEQRTRVAVAVVAALNERGRFFFHAERKDFDSAMFFDNDRKRLERIRSDSFVAWLSGWLRVNRADALFKFIAAQVETSALAGSETTGILPESFWASRMGTIYLSNGDGVVVRIAPGKIETVDNGTDGVLFSAGNTLAPWTLTEPQDPFSTCSLFSGANYAAKHGLDLSRIWLFSLPTNPACKPPLCLAGDVGSGKTRLAKGIAEFFGLPFVANKAEEQGEDSFWASLDAGGLFILDNADTRNKWLPDAVASAATDGCSQRRKLYTNSERVTLRSRAWLTLTTANPTFASDAGLADRLLVIRMNRRTDETSDARLSAEIVEHRDAGLSFIAHILATALADTQPTPACLNQRHPDFAGFGVRIGRAIGRETETVAALRTAEMDKSAFCIENDSIGAALLAHLQSVEDFIGTARELQERLIEADADLAEKLSVKRLSKRIAALWPHLEKVLATAKQEKDRKGFTIYTFKTAGKTDSADYAEFQTPI